MKTLAEQLAEMDAEHAKKREELINATAFFETLPAWVLEYNHGSPHWSKLYGSVVSMTWERVRYSSIQPLKSPDLDFAARLIAEFPPLAQVMHKDGCTSFRLADYPHREERATITPVSGFTIRIKSEERTAFVEWRAKVGDVVCWFKVEVALPAKLGRLDLVIKRDKYDGQCVERCEFSPSLGAQRIKWGTGGRQYANEFTLYWLDPSFTFADLAAQL